MQESDDYDNPWKEAIEGAFPEFMAFYFPEAAARIDWTRGFAFLDQELRQVIRDAESGKRYVDKLARVALLGGGEDWMHIHLEVQGRNEAAFPERNSSTTTGCSTATAAPSPASRCWRTSRRTGGLPATSTNCWAAGWT